MLGYGNRVSCRNIFKESNILSFESQYIFLLLLSVLQNKVLLPSNIDSHTIDTRQRQNFLKKADFWDLAQCVCGVNPTYTWCQIPEDCFLHSHHRESLKSYKIFCLPQANLTFYQTGVYYAGIKIQ